jgi:hypothetical protein
MKHQQQEAMLLLPLAWTHREDSGVEAREGAVNRLAGDGVKDGRLVRVLVKHPVESKLEAAKKVQERA